MAIDEIKDILRNSNWQCLESKIFHPNDIYSRSLYNWILLISNTISPYNLNIIDAMLIDEKYYIEEILNKNE